MANFVKWTGIVLAISVLGPLLILVMLWITSLPVWQFEKEDCAFGVVSDEQYKSVLGQAKRQSWTVWPGLSDGLFWPSDRGLRPSSAKFEQQLGERLREEINKLAGDRPSAEFQLAAAHAVMRSIGARLVNTSEVRAFPAGGRPHPLVYFRYFVPQRRFAPVCLGCLLWPYTTISVKFAHNLAANSYQFDSVIVLHGDLKYDPDPIKERNISSACPAFPVSKNN